MQHQQRGLTADEVAARRRAGQVNIAEKSVSKPLSRILFDNICTPFNAVNAIIATALILVQSYHNILFFGVVLCNTAIGIIQELRSKYTLEKLSLLCQPTATVVRDGQHVKIPAVDIVKDDVIVFESGDQISVDALVAEGKAEVNESLLTGEADAVIKQQGDRLLSGSFVVSGRCVAVATAVGNDSYAARLTAQAKTYKRLPSRLMESVNRIIRFSGIFMIPFAAALILRDYFSGTFVLKESVTIAAAALIGMMPQGLILLTTVALVVGVTKLARKHTLVQELYGIETLSRVSLLCLDKTGTITTGEMTAETALPFSKNSSAVCSRAHIAAALRAINDNNATATALKVFYEPFAESSDTAISRIYSFSSDRKWSAATIDGVGTIFFGAYDRLFDGAIPDEWHKKEQEGKRLLLVAFSRDETIEKALHSLVPIEAVVLEDTLRDNAAEILRFFTDEGVTLRIISGDHPKTVSMIAKKAGLDDWDLAVDATTLRTPEELAKAAETYVVFGRVSPEQKKTLVQLFKQQGHIVAMTGDGVNDVPALKEADCSIAVAAGSDAAKQVSQLVLLDSNFAALPTVVMEGRRIINNITRTASLFLVKTITSFLITFSTILLPMAYPFEPLQLTLIGIFAESVPGFFLTLEPYRERIRGDFMHTVMRNALPSGLLITASVIVIQLVLAPLFSLSAEQSSTLCVYSTGAIWLVQLFRICHPLTTPRTLLCVSMTIGFFGSALLLANVLPTLFAMLGYTMEIVFVIPTNTMVLITAIAAVAVLPLDYLLYRLCGRFFKKAM